MPAYVPPHLRNKAKSQLQAKSMAKSQAASARLAPSTIITEPIFLRAAAAKHWANRRDSVGSDGSATSSAAVSEVSEQDLHLLPSPQQLAPARPPPSWTSDANCMLSAAAPEWVPPPAATGRGDTATPADEAPSPTFDQLFGSIWQQQPAEVASRLAATSRRSSSSEPGPRTTDYGPRTTDYSELRAPSWLTGVPLAVASTPSPPPLQKAPVSAGLSGAWSKGAPLAPQSWSQRAANAHGHTPAFRSIVSYAAAAAACA
eukprot:SAG22_NODE_2562_length_2439_cov_1.936752_2_plen_259_part_00